MRVSRTGLIQHCLQRSLLWRHWSKSRRHQTALHCTARVSSLKHAQHEIVLIRGAVLSCMLWISIVCPAAFATMSLCLFFCAASNASSCAGRRNCYTGFAKACCQQSQAVQSSTRHEEGWPWLHQHSYTYASKRQQSNQPMQSCILSCLYFAPLPIQHLASRLLSFT